MDRFPQMLLKAGGPEQFHGGSFSTLIVQGDDELAAALAAGWHESTPAAVEAAAPKPAREPGLEVSTAAPTRAELEQKAAEMGIKFDGRWGDKRLADAIAAKLADASA